MNWSLKLNTVSVNVEVDPWDVIEEIDDDELIEHLKDSGWYFSREPDDPLIFSEIQFIMDLMDETDWQQKRIYDKLLKMREVSCH